MLKAGLGGNAVDVMAGQGVRAFPARIVIASELVHRGDKAIASVPILAQLRPHGVCQFVDRRLVLHPLQSDQLLIGVPVAASRRVVQIDDLEADVVSQPLLRVGRKGIPAKELVQKSGCVLWSRCRGPGRALCEITVQASEETAYCIQYGHGRI